MIKTRLREQVGRKVNVAGTVEDLEGNVLVEAEYVARVFSKYMFLTPICWHRSALFVQPRYAKLLNVDRIHARLGRPPSGADVVPVEGTLAPSPAIPPTAPGLTASA